MYHYFYFSVVDIMSLGQKKFATYYKLDKELGSGAFSIVKKGTNIVRITSRSLLFHADFKVICDV